ncbi:hypothetical protein P4534_12295 [Peribacillus butanolivorans]|uniref:hypothetical protein n=1 Tax=Peribacillus butanolivorans TaxID=421767 RepID=UPI002E20B477|nr:hypothetical protein [Peribacillus butanolivorans]
MARTQDDQGLKLGFENLIHGFGGVGGITPPKKIKSTILSLLPIHWSITGGI